MSFDDLEGQLKEFKTLRPDINIWVEPGRYLVAESGVLLAQVNQVKLKGQTHYIGVNTGMNSLIRPALYGSYHHIVNLSRLDEKVSYEANVVGPICESGDILGHARALPETVEADIMLIDCAGAYGQVMSSRYNLREPAKEVLIKLDQ